MGNRGAGAGGRASQFRRGEGRAQKSRKNKKMVLTNRTSRDSIGKRSGMTAKMKNARVVELADSLDSGSSVHYARAGSSPASRTTSEQALYRLFRLFYSQRALLSFNKTCYAGL